MAKKKIKKSKQFIGRREIVSFPEIGLLNIEAKIDSGAYTSAIHCQKITAKPNGIEIVFDTESSQQKPHVFTNYIKKEIKNSFGESELRYIIKTPIKIGNRVINCLISLTNRGQMRYPVLIGRRLLKNKFVVDVAKINIADQNLFL